MSIQPPVLNVFNIEQSASAPNHVHKLCELITETFVVPALYAQTTVKVIQSSQYQIGQWIWIQGSGFFRITGQPDATHLYVSNDGAVGSQSAGTVSVVGSILMACPEQELASISSSNVVFYDILTQPFTSPAVGSSADMFLGTVDSWGATGLTIYVQGGGFYTITAVDPVSLKATVTNADGNNAPAGTTVSVNSKVWLSPLPRDSIKSGVISNTTLTASQTDELLGTVTFATPFLVTPNVVLSVASVAGVSAVPGAAVAVYAISVSKTGFSVNYTNGATTGGIKIDVHWIATANGNL